MGDKFILNGKEPQPCNDLMAWAKWFETADRHVAKDQIGDVEVSTVFLGLNHGCGFKGSAPLLFETMVFGGPLDQEEERYATWGQAEQGHRDMVERVKAAPPPQRGGQVRHPLTYKGFCRKYVLDPERIKSERRYQAYLKDET